MTEIVEAYLSAQPEHQRKDISDSLRAVASLALQGMENLPKKVQARLADMALLTEVYERGDAEVLVGRIEAA